jgi:hypothetical protein
MANDEEHFRIRPGRVRDRAGGRTTRAVRPRPKTFLAEGIRLSAALAANPIGWARPGREAAGSTREAGALRPPPG